jgi:hypothetical protein
VKTLASCLLALVMLPGCVTLSAWERTTVMSRVMADPGNPLEHQLLDHVHAVREAASGATTAGGASCGCN